MLIPKNNWNVKWLSYSPSIVLTLLIVLFTFYSVFIAFNLQPGIIPDEPAHFAFSKHFSSTWRIPPDVPETYQLGWYIKQNPFLYFWINGRVINSLEFVYPAISDWQLFVSLRLLNVLYGLGTVIFCFFLSQEQIKNRWWQLLPVFLLTNTLMFVVLSGGVNYDNLTNLLSIVGLFFWVRALKQKMFLKSSMGWLISISAGALVKYTILPLALAMFVAWMIFIFRNRKQIFPLVFTGKAEIIMFLILTVLAMGNLALYGYNLIVYQGIRPQCVQILPLEQCRDNPFTDRFEEFALEDKLTISKSIELGYPDPITYIIDSWIPNMFYRIFGILGHLSYFPTRIIIFYRLLLFWNILLVVKYWQRPSYVVISIASIFIFYTLILFYNNYNNELVYGFRQIAMQGRYIFPVIGIGYVLYGKFLHSIPNRLIKISTLITTIMLFFFGGPVKFFLFFDTVFSSWFF